MSICKQKSYTSGKQRYKIY